MTTARDLDRSRLTAGLDGVMMFAVLLTLAGYLLPWFRQSSGHRWSYSGWGYASLSTGGGWTLITFAFLLAVLVASFWARASVAAAMTALTATFGTLVMALAVVAASFANIGPRDNSNAVAERPFGIGLPLLGIGLGLLVATACRDIVRAHRIREPAPTADSGHRPRDDEGAGERDAARDGQQAVPPR